MLLMISSMPRINASVQIIMCQPGSMAKASSSGNSAATAGPRYGTKRNTPERNPHSSAPGTPMSQRPNAIGMP